MLESVKILFDDTETMNCGSKLARCFSDSPNDSSVIYLKGDLGAGKTTFAKGFLRGMGYEGNVTSPTYTLIELYRTEVYDIYHVDLYRIETRKEIFELELNEEPISSAPYIFLIEWPENGLPDILEADFELSFSLEESLDQRTMNVICNTKKSSNILTSWLK